jgi:holliday junction DNA helicase RuvA
MFNSVRGILTEKRADSVCIDVEGVEFELLAPSRSLDSFGRIGDVARAFTWLHHYEDGMRLYGFPSVAERTVFLELMRVEGIGPKQGLRILSGIAPDALDAALAGDDLAALQRVPGVGPKLAQKILLALKGKLILDAGSGGRGAGNSAPQAWADVIRALVDMGFDRKAAEKSVMAVTSSVPEGPDREREIFRRALLDLSAGA